MCERSMKHPVKNLLLAKLRICVIILVCYVICAATGQTLPPTIQTIPQAVTAATEGDPVTIYCTVKNLGTYNVSWLRNGKIITRNKEILIDPTHYEISQEDDGGYHLKIKQIKRTDSNWKYRCAIYNHNVMITTHDNPATIQVSQIPQAKYPICDPIENGYNENTTITVSCRAEIIYPKVGMEWRKNGTLVAAKSTQVNGEEVLSYTFTAQQKDSGSLLKCSMHVIPTGEKLHCTPGQLNIMYKPNITIHKPDMVSAGKEAVYICLATANPTITSYTWHVPPSLRKYNFKSNHGVLRITPSQSDNMTQIACTASNQIGNVTKYITIKLQKSDGSKVTTKVSKSSVDYIGTENDTISLFAIVLVAVGCSSLILLLMVIPVCYYYTCQRQEEGLYMPRRLPIMVQPDVYSEPKDMAFSDPNQNRTLPMLPSGTIHGKWKRSVGVQVPLEIEIEDVYAHVEGEVGSLNLSRVRSTKSEYV